MVESEVSNAFVVGCPNQFFGIDEHGCPAREQADFTAVRQRLLAEGYDCVVTDSSLGEHSGIWCVLDPSRLRIIGEMTPDQAVEADSQAEYENVTFSGSGILFPENDAEPPTP